MLITYSAYKIWLIEHRVDFRKQHQGLLAEAYHLNLNPFKGDVLIFLGRNRRRLKVLYADDSGLWLSSKLFTKDAMKTKIKFLSDRSCKAITKGELEMITEGTRYLVQKII